MSVLRMGREKKEGDVRQSLGACRIEDPSLSSSLVHLSANPRVPTNQYHSLFFSIVHDVRIDSIARRRILEYEPSPFLILRTPNLTLRRTFQHRENKSRLLLSPYGSCTGWRGWCGLSGNSTDFADRDLPSLYIT